MHLVCGQIVNCLVQYYYVAMNQLQLRLFSTAAPREHPLLFYLDASQSAYLFSGVLRTLATGCSVCSYLQTAVL
jgi:hypothetical protein